MPSEDESTSKSTRSYPRLSEEEKRNALKALETVERGQARHSGAAPNNLLQEFVVVCRQARVLARKAGLKYPTPEIFRQAAIEVERSSLSQSQDEKEPDQDASEQKGQSES